MEQKSFRTPYKSLQFEYTKQSHVLQFTSKHNCGFCSEQGPRHCPALNHYLFGLVHIVRVSWENNRNGRPNNGTNYNRTNYIYYTNFYCLNNNDYYYYYYHFNEQNARSDGTDENRLAVDNRLTIYLDRKWRVREIYSFVRSVCEMWVCHCRLWHAIAIPNGGPAQIHTIFPPMTIYRFDKLPQIVNKSSRANKPTYTPTRASRKCQTRPVVGREPVIFGYEKR